MASLRHYARGFLFQEGEAPVYARPNRHPWSESPHDHEFIEIVLVTGGSAVHETPGEVRPIGPGSVLLLRPGAWHAYRQCRNLEIVNCCFGPELLREELAWMIDDPVLGPLLWGGGEGVALFRLPAAAAAQCRRLLRELQGAVDRKAPAPASRHERIARLALFLSVLGAAGREKGAGSFAKAGPVPAALTASLRAIEGGLSRPWTLAELARESGVSREHLIRLFRRKTGLTPMAYLARRRAERAAFLLGRTLLPVGEVGAAVGWESPVHFARRFRARFGVSATGYRARLREAK